MAEEIDKIEWKTRYQIIVDEYYDTPEEAQIAADKICDCADVSTFIEEIETSY
ncbi:hypothetical protein KAU33_15800 [Candidatus Dependentiae bacterium]|nr:hypothetical protein [Candidatus Dependentiae bacterium]